MQSRAPYYGTIVVPTSSLIISNSCWLVYKQAFHMPYSLESVYTQSRLLLLRWHSHHRSTGIYWLLNLSGNLRNLHPYSHISLGKVNFIRTVGLLEYFIIFFSSVRSIYSLGRNPRLPARLSFSIPSSWWEALLKPPSSQWKALLEPRDFFEE